MKVCDLYFNKDFTIAEIVEVMEEDLRKYAHTNYEGTQVIGYPTLAAERIIKCERQAHMQVKNFTDL